MRIFKVAPKHERAADREVSERKARVQARLSSMSDLDRIVLAKVALRPFAQIRQGKTQRPIDAQREYERNRTLEYVVSRDDRGAKVPRTVLGSPAPRRTEQYPRGYPKRTALQSVLAYGSKSKPLPTPRVVSRTVDKRTVEVLKRSK